MKSKRGALGAKCEFNLDRLRDFLSISSENCIAGYHFNHDSALHLSNTILKVIRTEVWQTCQPCHFLTVSPKFLRAHCVPLQKSQGWHGKQDKVSKVDALTCASLPNMYPLISQCRLRWLGHVHRTEGGWSHPKRHLWHSSIGYENHRHPPAAIKNICIRE